MCPQWLHLLQRLARLGGKRHCNHISKKSKRKINPKRAACLPGPCQFQFQKMRQQLSLFASRKRKPRRFRRDHRPRAPSPTPMSEFVAPDGTEFETQRKLNRYLYANYYSWKNKEGETKTVAPGSVNGCVFFFFPMQSSKDPLRAGGSGRAPAVAARSAKHRGGQFPGACPSTMLAKDVRGRPLSCSQRPPFALLAGSSPHPKHSVHTPSFRPRRISRLSHRPFVRVFAFFVFAAYPTIF